MGGVWDKEGLLYSAISYFGIVILFLDYNLEMARILKNYSFQLIYGIDLF